MVRKELANRVGLHVCELTSVGLGLWAVAILIPAGKISSCVSSASAL